MFRVTGEYTRASSPQKAIFAAVAFWSNEASIVLRDGANPGTELLSIPPSSVSRRT